MASPDLCSVRDCARSVDSLGLCEPHHHRLRRHGDVQADVPIRPRSAKDRFWLNVAKTGSCWLWTGSRTPEGYGLLSVAGVKSLAHRLAYEWLVGPIPEGLTIDHVKARGCRHRHCVNPAHLEPVTQRENVMRGSGLAAINARKTHCIHGHEFTPENTYIHTRRGGVERACKTCSAEGKRRRRANRWRPAEEGSR